MSQQAVTQDNFKRQIIIAHSFDIVKEQVVSNPNLFDEMQGLSGFQKAIRKVLTSIDNADSFVNYLENTGLTRLEEAGKMLNENDSLHTEYLWKVGNYCDKSLRLIQDASSTLQPDIDPKKYCEIVIRNYFKAMDKGHTQAITNFPRLLELLELYPETGPLFKECVSIVIDIRIFLY